MNSDLKKNVAHAISLLDKLDDLTDSHATIDFLEKNGIDKTYVENIYLFTPIVFCRKMLPNIKFPNTYLELSKSGEKVKKSYRDNRLYKIIESETDKYFKDSPDSNKILKIAGLSSEFIAINQLLQTEEGDSLKNIKLTEIVIVR